MVKLVVGCVALVMEHGPPFQRQCERIGDNQANIVISDPSWSCLLYLYISTLV